MNPVAKWLKRIETSYKITLGSDGGKDALADLRKFCYVNRPPIGDDPYQTYRLIGRQEVFQRIADNLNLTIEETYKLEEDFDYE